MSFFSNLDTAIQEQAAGRGREPVAIGAVGVCLEDSGQPVDLYRVSEVWPDGGLCRGSLVGEQFQYLKECKA